MASAGEVILDGTIGDVPDHVLAWATEEFSYSHDLGTASELYGSIENDVTWAENSRPTQVSTTENQVLCSLIASRAL
jgi:hypothetical protein